MAIDRQDCVLRPFKRRMGRNNIPKVIALSWIGKSGFNLSHNLQISSPTIRRMWRYSKGHRNWSYVGILSNSFNIASVLIIVVTALRIIKRLRSSPVPQSKSPHRRQESKLLSLTYEICGVFIVCKLPTSVYFPVAIFLEKNDYTLANFLVIALTMSNFHYVVNPFLYYNMLRPAVRRARNIELN